MGFGCFVFFFYPLFFVSVLVFFSPFSFRAALVALFCDGSGGGCAGGCVGFAF